jgi:hypothetical protein
VFTDEGEVTEAIVGALKLALHSLGFAFLLVSFLELRLARNEDGKGPSMDVGTFDIFALLLSPGFSGDDFASIYRTTYTTIVKVFHWNKSRVIKVSYLLRNNFP